ncbi:hypothetical protein BH23BAC1_BH23BAC1_32670 [soil metagenome]
MYKVYITNFDKNKVIPRYLFPLVRPFYNSKTGNWESSIENLSKWNCLDLGISITSSMADSDFILISEPLDHLGNNVKYRQLAEINEICAERKIFAYQMINGDFGKVHPTFSNIIYYRLGGFKSQLNKNNKAYFPFVRDHLKEYYDQKVILRSKNDKATIGFCGYASNSISKRVFEKFKMAKINFQRAKEGDMKFEKLYASGYERYKLLKSIEQSNLLKTNFIFRKKYRAGAVTEDDRVKSALEYLKNIIDSDYVLCLRGSGNFSVRLYETLMMGRIPVFVNTDCILPLEDEINWKNHVVWVEWKDRKNISQIVSEFHRNITQDDFYNMQQNNRKFWKSYLSIEFFLKNIVQKTHLNVRA